MEHPAHVSPNKPYLKIVPVQGVRRPEDQESCDRYCCQEAQVCAGAAERQVAGAEEHAMD